MQIETSFDTWKTLTSLLRDEQDTYDAVITRLLRGGQEEDQGTRKVAQTAHGAFFKGAFLPEGTELRATYKGKTYFANISGSEWIDAATGESRSSPSQAAYFITGSGVNGWLFWLVKRPGDTEWQSLNSLRGG